jgi:hypothetical protein
MSSERKASLIPYIAKGRQLIWSICAERKKSAPINQLIIF